MTVLKVEVEPFVSPLQVSEGTGLSVEHLAQLRFTGRGPKFYKPTPRKVFYRMSEVLAWIQESERTSTAEVLA